MIRARIDRIADALLGRHVARRAGDEPLAALGELDVVLAREAEVADADAPGMIDEHVRRLEVAVDQAGVVRGGEAFAGLHERADDLAPRAAASRASARSVSPGTSSMTRNTWPSIVADLVHRDDVRMRELRHRLRLADQPRAGLGARAAALHDLDRDAAIEIGVVRLEHDAHAAGAELAHDAEVADRVARRERRDPRHAIAGICVERSIWIQRSDHARRGPYTSGWGIVNQNRLQG